MGCPLGHDRPHPSIDRIAKETSSTLDVAGMFFHSISHRAGFWEYPQVSDAKGVRLPLFQEFFSLLRVCPRSPRRGATGRSRGASAPIRIRIRRNSFGNVYLDTETRTKEPLHDCQRTMPGRRPANPPDHVAEGAAKASGFVRRRRKITGAGFVQSLVLGWMADPRAKLEDLAATLGVADQSLDERFNDRAVDCLKRVLNAALGILFEARPEAIPLIRRFTAVALEDSTALTLPASLAPEYPGCGGSDEAGTAGMKVMARLEAIAGGLEFSEPGPA